VCPTDDQSQATATTVSDPPTGRIVDYLRLGALLIAMAQSSRGRLLKRADVVNLPTEGLRGEALAVFDEGVMATTSIRDMPSEAKVNILLSLTLDVHPAAARRLLEHFRMRDTVALVEVAQRFNVSSAPDDEYAAIAGVYKRAILLSGNVAGITATQIIVGIAHRVAYRMKELT
jgi:hypothetical protein